MDQFDYRETVDGAVSAYLSRHYPSAGRSLRGLLEAPGVDERQIEEVRDLLNQAVVGFFDHNFGGISDTEADGIVDGWVQALAEEDTRW